VVVVMVVMVVVVVVVVVVVAVARGIGSSGSGGSDGGGDGGGVDNAHTARQCQIFASRVASTTELYHDGGHFLDGVDAVKRVRFFANRLPQLLPQNIHVTARDRQIQQHSSAFTHRATRVGRIELLRSV
jgi:hypothetical protein